MNGGVGAAGPEQPRWPIPSRGPGAGGPEPGEGPRGSPAHPQLLQPEMGWLGHLHSETTVSRGTGTAVQSVSDLAGWEFPFSGLPVGALFQISTAGKPAILHNDFSMPRSGAPRPCYPAAPLWGRQRLSRPPPGPGQGWSVHSASTRAHARLTCVPSRKRGSSVRGGAPRSALVPGARAGSGGRAGRDVMAGRGRGSTGRREAGEVFSSFKKAGGRARPCVRARL